MTSSSSSNPSFVMEGSEVEEKVTKERGIRGNQTKRRNDDNEERDGSKVVLDN